MRILKANIFLLKLSTKNISLYLLAFMINVFKKKIIYYRYKQINEKKNIRRCSTKLSIDAKHDMKSILASQFVLHFFFLFLKIRKRINKNNFITCKSLDFYWMCAKEYCRFHL